MQYRSEIDGLRAVAVIPVILFHAGFDSFSGGFAGVDIFFVISGYLITTIIVSDLDQGRFTLRRFYERRVRRILPALSVVLGISFLLAWLLLLPVDMRSFSRDLLGVVLFASNFLFWADTDYWGAATELNPLLHTWSLAVEEQFYLVFPLLLMWIWKWQQGNNFRRGPGWRRILPLIIFGVLGVGSLVLSEWSTSRAPMAGYFLLPGRAWELLLGAIIALSGSQTSRAGAVDPIKQIAIPLRELAGLTGLVMILVSILVLDDSVPFPGLRALLPTLGAGLILQFASSETLTGRLLSLRPLVGFGLISYSAYLWHQPLLAFLRHVSIGAPDTLIIVVTLGVTFLLASLTWLLVELPFRKGRVLTGVPLFQAALACSLALIAVGIAGQKSYGFINRAAGAEVYLAWADKTRINFGLHEICDGRDLDASQCRTSASPELLIWGDSYAMHLVRGILTANPAAAMVQMTRSACAPFLNVASLQSGSAAAECLEFNRQVAMRIDSLPSLKYAVLSSPFSSFFGASPRLVNNDGVSVRATGQLVDTEFRKTLGFLLERGIVPVIFSPPPANGGTNIGRCLGRAEYFARQLSHCNFALDRGSEEQKQVFAWLRELNEEFQVVFLDQLLCPEGLCRAHDGETFFYRDSGHLSVDGSGTLGHQADFYNLIAGTGNPAIAQSP
ncbi:MAG: acyltransferase family protein [Gammaproteobacteria bacterium]|nr:acyltransferase [Pseudomonadales bacterium]MCP5345294.1 acyltransferase [Pseudomonadales bacterium]